MGNSLKIIIRILAASLCALLTLGQSAIAETPEEQQYLAVVNGYPISEQTYITALREEARQRFYHGKLTQQRLDELQADVSKRLINNVLLTQEAEARGIEPDQSVIDEELKAIEEANRDHPDWAEQGEAYLAMLAEQLASRERIRLLEQQVREVKSPQEAALKTFYQQNPELFTVPEKRRVSLILKKVAPSAGAEAWREAEQFMGELRGRIVAGESFAEIARAFSEDESAANGGDMGLQHRGMLHKDVEEQIDTLPLATVSEPLRLLIGYVLVRVEERQPPMLQEYEASRSRVLELYHRETAQKQWDALLDKLSSEATVVRNERLLNLTVD